MKNNFIKNTPNLYYDQFVHHRKHHICCDEKHFCRQQCLHMAVVNVTNSTEYTGNPFRSVILSVLVEI
jgi:hypothetical protein